MRSIKQGDSKHTKQPVRLTDEQRNMLRQLISGLRPNSDMYLFGSRTDMDNRGGDIDILIIDDTMLTIAEQSTIWLAFCRRCGEQKVDLVSFRLGSTDAFLPVAMSTAVRL